jgi:predicted metal-dependent hydrolase
MFLEQLKLFRMPEPPPPAKARHLLVGGRIVEYRVKTGVRRLSMTIDERGLRINLPPRVTQAETESFVREHAAWVLKKLDELTQTAQRRHLRVRDGLRLPLLGGEAGVRVLPGANRLRWVGDTLLLEARADADLNALAVRALQRRALPHFQARLDDCCARLGLPVPPLGLSSAGTRWGSCSRESGIRINWRLIHLPAELGDYVVAHEAAHLLEMNHSKRFWSIVERLHPGCKHARTELRRSAASLPIL